MRTTPAAANSGRMLLTVEEAARALRIGRTTSYRLVADGQIDSIQIGHLRRIPIDALARFVRSRSDAAATSWTTPR